MRVIVQKPNKFVFFQISRFSLSFAINQKWLEIGQDCYGVLCSLWTLLSPSFVWQIRLNTPVYILLHSILCNKVQINIVLRNFARHIFKNTKYIYIHLINFRQFYVHYVYIINIKYFYSIHKLQLHIYMLISNIMQ